MPVADTQLIDHGLLASLLSDERFWPSVPRKFEETGLSENLVESLIAKFLATHGTTSGRKVATSLCLPFGLLEGMLATLRTRQLLVHAGSAPFNDYYYSLTEQGRAFAQACLSSCAYVGPAPVLLNDYIISVEAQAISAEPIHRDRLQESACDICVDESLFELLGPAVNSGAGMFLYGAPGNGKSTLAKAITGCFGQHVWLPYALIDDGQLIKVFDASYHHPIPAPRGGVVKSIDYDQRWLQIRRPTVVVGGELTMDALEIRHDPRTNISEAPLQLKSNCGCLLIDDFGRQRVAPAELLNRWIIPLENRHDFLTLATGKKIQVPFEQLIIFSTNLDPSHLADEAFLRRIPYKIHIQDPDEEEFHRLFQMCAPAFGCEYDPQPVEHLLASHYRPFGRALRRCHPRDFLVQLRNYCAYHDLPVEMRCEYFDQVARSYFTSPCSPQPMPPLATPPPDQRARIPILS